MQLLVDVMGALIHDTQRPKHSTFHVAVAVADWISREDTMRRLFDPARSYADTFAWVRESLHNLAESEIPATIATVWRHLHPAFVALQAAFRGYTSYRAGHPHDFSLPADVTTWYPRPQRVQSTAEYLACIGDKNFSRVAQHYYDDYAPSVHRPLLTTKHCGRGHAYLDVATTAERDDRHWTVPPSHQHAVTRAGSRLTALVSCRSLPREA